MTEIDKICPLPCKKLVLRKYNIKLLHERYKDNESEKTWYYNMTDAFIAV